MVEAVSRHGFASTTIRELVTLAGVSKSTFYDHFESKEACFLSAFDDIVAQVTEDVASAYRQGEDPQERLPSALRRVMEIVTERPEAIAFVTVDSLTLGEAAVLRREAAWQPFEAMSRRYFEDVEPGAAISDLTNRAIVAGLTGVIYRRLRSGRQDDLPSLVEPLVEWMRSYATSESDVVRRAATAAEQPIRLPSGSASAEQVPWGEPPDSSLSRSTLSQRERIVRAAARVVIERGFDGLSIPAISAAAGTSNQTFYENFKSKRDPFLEAYEGLSETALRVSSAPLEGGESPEAIGTALRTLTEYIAGNPIYARLAFFELQTAGSPALDRADKTMDLLISVLAPDSPESIGGTAPRPALEATAAGIWFVIQREVGHGRARELPDKAPELARITLAPLDAG